MAVVTKKCYYSNTSKFIEFYFYSKSMMKSRKRRVNESKKLEAKREMHDAKEKEGTKKVTKAKKT